MIGAHALIARINNPSAPIVATPGPGVTGSVRPIFDGLLLAFRGASCYHEPGCLTYGRMNDQRLWIIFHFPSMRQ